MEKEYQCKAYANTVDLIDSIYFGDAVIAKFAPANELFPNHGGIESLILGKREGKCQEVFEINDAHTNGEDVTVEFDRTKVKQTFLSKILGAENVFYDGIVKVNDIPKYSFFNMYREKGNQKTILECDLKALK